ncbi:MAG: CBS and ACT domain-containing protein [Desulfatiglandaceae bacterium]|jgi:acetoin utilization protein AcuB
MLVKNWMNKAVFTATVEDSMADATRLMKENHVEMLPVMKGKELVGIITDRDLKRASASDATTLEVHELLYLLSELKIKNIMSKNPITIPFDFTVEEAAEVLLHNKVSGAPVIDHEGRIVGTIDKEALFKVLISLTGVEKRGIEFAFQLEDRPGSIKEVADVIRKYGGRMASILTTYEGVPKGYRKVYIRMYNVDRPRLPELKQELTQAAAMLYMVDHRTNQREIY